MWNLNQNRKVGAFGQIRTTRSVLNDLIDLQQRKNKMFIPDSITINIYLLNNILA